MWGLGLRGRMAASYVLVTITAVLLVEAAVVAVFLIPQAAASDLAGVLEERAAGDAKAITQEADRLAATGRDADALLRDADALLRDAAAASRGRTLAGGARPHAEPGLAMLETVVNRDGLILASSAPGIYRPGTRLDLPLPIPAPRQARPPVAPPVPPLPERNGDGGGGNGRTRTGPTVWHLSPVQIKNPDGPGVIGFVHVQAPADADPATMPDLTPMVVLTLLVLALVVPVGLVFGLLSTRRLIGRVRRLADVTTAVAAGDFRPRVAVSGSDEVSTLEQSFNAMTDRLGAAVETASRTARTEARQAERGRIARELHDSISQDLFSLSLLAAGMRRAAPRELRGQAEAMERTSARAMREMQALLLELRPVALEDAGLTPALEELCRAYETRLGLRVEAVLEEVALEAAAEHAVLRLVQEALGNAVKHAAPSEVEVRLCRDGDGAVVVSVTDDGTGFDPADVAGRHGMGLTLMRERVTELGGRLTVSSGEGGTTVTARLT
ncbi:HAMP domain-containing protein [Actinomadura sp. ATCC 31491]|uniref:histidine kinase n=1 Tax=Actinomadura luzonensis TaxID=2805427 RepID=A0ABT0FZE9_9ACTN|nr:ATP-binding protein [Actinomadura luzonensis]MCK2217690.1 HAMP domain-containing protein [Actinomadura luzonensis]